MQATVADIWSSVLGSIIILLQVLFLCRGVYRWKYTMGHQKLKGLKGCKDFGSGSVVTPSCLQMKDKEQIYNELILSKK